MVSIKRVILFACMCFPLLGAGELFAQRTISGKITDKETHRPLDGASALLFIAGQKTASAFAVTDANGDYTLKLRSQFGDSLQVEVSMLGYAKEIISVNNGSRRLDVEMVPQSSNLKEVVVRANKLWQERDTLNYNVALFKTPQDRVIGDVLKKLPGIDVSQNGAISYNGKPISNFYVEGSDLLGGKYGLATKNIPADAVKKVQVLENHQAIKALEKSDFSDQAAINLVLKDGAKSRWLGKIDAGFGASPFLWDGRVMGMRVGRGMQSMNVYKTNNIGNNVTDELISHTFDIINFSNENNADQADWLSVIMPAAPPVSENRYLFNQSHLLSTNNLWKLNDDYQLRANVSYVNNQHDFDTEARTVYYLEADSTLTISELQKSNRKQHQLEGAFTFTANSPSYYLQNSLKLRGRWNETNANTWSGVNTIGQQLNTPNHLFSNDFQWIKNKGLNTFQVSSFNSYSLLPQELLISGVDWMNLGGLSAITTDGNLCQNLHSTSFFSNSYATFKTKKNSWRLELKTGFQAQVQHVDSEIRPVDSQGGVVVPDSLKNDFGLEKYVYSLQPLLGYQNSKLRLSLTLPVNFTTINSEYFTIFNPSFSFNYDVTAYWNIMGSARYSSSFGDIRSIIPNYILYNYRSIERNPNDLLEQVRQSYTLNITYRNPITAFFAAFAGSYMRGVSNLLYNRSFHGILSERTAVKQDNDRQTWTLTGKVSKTVDSWNTTFWLDAGYSYTTAEQLSQHQWTRFASETFSLRPKVVVKPAYWTNVEYEASFARSQLKILEPQTSQSAPILSMSHFLTWSFNFIKKLQAYVHGEYYYNHAANTSYPAVFFVDAGVSYTWKQFEFSVDCRNILNNKRYEYSVLGTLSESFSAYKLRPMSVMAKVSWAF